MGAWSYIKPRLDTAMRELGGPAGLEQRHLRYVGRTASASVGAPVSPTCDVRYRRQLALLRDSSWQFSVPSLHPARLLLDQPGYSHTCRVLKCRVRCACLLAVNRVASSVLRVSDICCVLMRSHCVHGHPQTGDKAHN